MAVGFRQNFSIDFRPNLSDTATRPASLSCFHFKSLGFAVGDILNSKEAAEYLRIDGDTLLAYEKAGLVASIRYPSLQNEGEPRRTRLYRKEELQRFVRACETSINVTDAGPNLGPNSKSQSTEITVNKALRQQGQRTRKQGDANWIEKFTKK